VRPARAAALLLLLLLVFLRPAAGQSPRALRLTFIGDIMAHDVNYLMRDYGDIYRGVEDVFQGSDCVVANFELPVDPARPAAGYPLFNGTRAYLRAAIDAGVNVFSTANNHACDGGVEGVFQTLRAFASLPAVGGRTACVSGTRGNAHRPFLPQTVIVGGARVGFIAVTQFVNERDPGGHVHVVDYSDEAAVRDFLGFVKAASPFYDLFIVSYHGDREYVQEPSPAKRAFFHRLLEAGAHVVFGHHPHVVQRYEVLSMKGADRLIMYSMGNFISGMTWRRQPDQMGPLYAATGESYMLRVDVRFGGGGCTLTAVEPIPIANYMNGRDEMVVGRMSALADGGIPVSPAWRSYYAGRLGLMKRFYPEAGGALIDPVRSASAP
jgi:poly-gamma-glutamate capsule biosynthesis protein CapA/YwtB (metallophosphatase superfamily)